MRLSALARGLRTIAVSCLIVLCVTSCVPHESYTLEADLRADGCRVTLNGHPFAPHSDSTMRWNDQAALTELFGVLHRSFFCGGDPSPSPRAGYALFVSIPIDSAKSVHLKDYRLGEITSPRLGLEVANVSLFDVPFTDSAAAAVGNLGGLRLEVVSGTLTVTGVDEGRLIGHLNAKVQFRQSTE